MSGTDMIPLPRPTALSKPHWDGCRDGVLRVQRCGACEHYVFIPQAVCTRCQADALEWVEFVAAKFAGMLHTGGVQAGGHQVDEVPGLALDAAVFLGINALGPRHD